MNINRPIRSAAAVALLALSLSAAVTPAAASVTTPIVAPRDTPTVAPLIAADPKPPLVLTSITAAPTKVNYAKPAPPKPAQVQPAWIHPLPNGARGHSGGCFNDFRSSPWVHYHKGVDLTAPSGMPIRAVHSGVVVAHAYQAGGAGNYVAIDHGDGYQTVYMHLIRPGLPVGTHVNTGDVIGYVGATGDASGPHLHFEVHHGLWHRIDPAPFMRARGVNVGC